jgi:hypothetical protein
MSRADDERLGETRRSWNLATQAHNRHKRDQAGFLREGGSTLFPEETELVGELRGQRLLHLLCNAGQDTLSLASRGARVTGVDLSDEAITFATRLAGDANVPERRSILPRDGRRKQLRRRVHELRRADLDRRHPAPVSRHRPGARAGRPLCKPRLSPAGLVL